MLRVMIIDDEPLARQGLRQMLDSLGEVEVCGEAESLQQAMDSLPALQPDGLFLDIEMPGGGGFELLSRLENPPPVVFFTAHSEFAARAFDVQAVDYLLKPVRRERLRTALTRLREAAVQYGEGDRICLRTPGRTLVAPLEKIVLLEAEGDFTRVSVEGEPPLLICQSLGSYENTLPSPPFLRLDRSLIVNTARVESITSESGATGRVRLVGIPSSLPLGRTALRRLRGTVSE
ncbi:MAG: LytR/AlgR family response regulator transcription factor [Verrucomicrobiota bacterium]